MLWNAFDFFLNANQADTGLLFCSGVQLLLFFLTAENMHEMPVKYSTLNRVHFQTELFERQKYTLCT